MRLDLSASARETPCGQQYGPCLFCRRQIAHVDSCVLDLPSNGWLLGALLPTGETRYFMYCLEDCAPHKWEQIWRCACDDTDDTDLDYVENVGDACHGCLRPLEVALAPWRARAASERSG